MSSQGLAFTAMFVLDSNTQFRLGPPRALTSPIYTDDFNAVKALGAVTSDRRERRSRRLSLRSGRATPPLTGIKPRTRWRRANHLSMSDNNRLLAVLNIAMADTAITTFSAKRFYGDVSFEVTWRPVTSIPLADTDGNPGTVPEPGWLPLLTTPSHPEYPLTTVGDL